MALTLSVQTSLALNWVQLSAYRVGACWGSEPGWNTPKSYLASARNPVNCHDYGGYLTITSTEMTSLSHGRAG